MDNFGNRQTTLDLNGPIISFLENPEAVGTCNTVGLATFTGVGTATFPSQDPLNPAVGTGSLAYQWYVDAGSDGNPSVLSGPLTDGEDIVGLGLTSISGAATTTLTVYGSSPKSHGLKFKLNCDYVPSAYVQPTGVAVTVGTARSTPHALNELAYSGIATLSVYPTIGITSQPGSWTIFEQGEVNFHIDAELTDDTQGGLSYEWILNGTSVSDGTVTETFTTSSTVVGPFEKTYISNTTLQVPEDATNVVAVVCGGVGGKGGGNAGGLGGDGRCGRFYFPDGARKFSIYTGRKGEDGQIGAPAPSTDGGASTYGPGGEGGSADTQNQGNCGSGGGGGGATTLWEINGSGPYPDTGIGDNVIISAGGGGGGGQGAGGQSGESGRGVRPGVGLGYGRGTVGNFSEQTKGGAINGRNGAAVGNNQDGGGGGGGGGGSGNSNYTPFSDGGGGDGRTGGQKGSGGASAYNSSKASFNFDGFANHQDGYVNIKYTGTTTTPESTTRTTTISGSNTKKLTLSANSVGIQTVRCKITHSTSCDSPVYSGVGNFNVISSRQVLHWELLTDADGSNYGFGSQNLFDTPKIFYAASATLNRSLVVYSPEQDIALKITMAAAAGVNEGYSPSNQVQKGGEGGTSVFYLTLKKNLEYVVKLGSTTAPSGGIPGDYGQPGGGGSYLYRGGTLLVALGGGGGGGQLSRGGHGGGIGLAGEKAPGGGNTQADHGLGGKGGILIPTGTLPLQGYFAGGLWSPPVNPRARDGGRVSGCTFGDYWLQQGFSACENMGEVQWRGANGDEARSSATITRGYKPGIAHRNNGGNADFEDWSSARGGGGGGSGAVGGDAGTWKYGGGGGSGYSNGVVSLLSSTLGGNTSTDGYIKFEVV